MVFRSLFTCCFGQLEQPSRSYIDASNSTITRVSANPHPNPCASKSKDYSGSRSVHTPPLQCHPALRNTTPQNYSPTSVSSSSIYKRPRPQPRSRGPPTPHSSPPELAHLRTASSNPNPAFRRRISRDNTTALLRNRNEIYDWDTPCEQMLPPGYKIVLSESTNELKLAKKGQNRPVNGLVERTGYVVSIGEVLEERLGQVVDGSKDCKYTPPRPG
jgi:hypothetical protein